MPLLKLVLEPMPSFLNPTFRPCLLLVLSPLFAGDGHCSGGFSGPLSLSNVVDQGLKLLGLRPPQQGVQTALEINTTETFLPRGIANVTIRDRRRVIALYLPVLSRTHPSAVILLSSL